MLHATKKKYFGGRDLQKIARVDGKYFWLVGGPSLFSPAAKTFIKVGLNKMVPFLPGDHALQVLFLAITRKCPLRCQHCFEGDHLGAQECLSLDDLKKTLSYFQQRGVAQVQFSGGEPMSRYSDLLQLLKVAKPGTDFWMNTSGFLMDYEKASELKSAGLTGCIISLDHFRPSEHNKFRNNPRAFDWAREAIKSVVKAGMPVTLSLCATREFVSQENLISYAELARDLGVTFIQLLEPKATGFYKHKEVHLSKWQKALLEDFYWKMTFDPQYHDWPIVSYHEYHKPALNCGGAGDRFLYVNSVGQIQACPFCEKSFGSILDDHHHDGIEQMKMVGCPDLN